MRISSLSCLFFSLCCICAAPGQTPPGAPPPPRFMVPPTVEGAPFPAAVAVMYEGMRFANAGLYPEAIEKLETVLSLDPALLDAWEALGWVYGQEGRTDDAKTLWERLVVIAPNEPLGYNLLAQLANRDGDFGKAISLYEKSIQLNPDQFEARLELARNLLSDGRQLEALRLFQRLFAEAPERLDVEIDLAWSLYVEEQYEDVLEHWNRIIEKVPDNPGFLLARANVLILIGEMELARMDASEALDLEPKNTAALDILVSLAMRSRSPFEAIEALDRVLENTVDPEAKAMVEMRTAAYMKSFSERQPDLFAVTEILDRIRRSLDLDDTKVDAHLFYGEMLIANRQFVTAEQVFRFVLEEFNPQNHRARFGLVETYFGRNMLDEIEQQLRVNFRDFNPNDPFRHLLWARLSFARGHFQEAMAALDRLEVEGSHGAVFSLLYHGVNPSEFSDMPSARQIREHLSALRRDGFRFITPSQLEAYFENKEPAKLSDERPWLYRMAQSVRRAWRGDTRSELMRLSDYSPEKVVLVTFDDGMRNSFRYGSRISNDLGVPLTMFVGVGDVISKELRSIASFAEIRQFMQEADWEIQSHLWDAGQLAQISEDGRRGLPIPNRLWLEDRGRLESLREYQARLKREFGDSRRVLARELQLQENEIIAVAYPLGEVGQETQTNISAFDVTRTVLNEAEIHYRLGFHQHRFGYSMKTDDPMHMKRYEPDREATGRDVLRAAYLQHPVFIARRTRVEMATLQGQLHLALQNIDLLKRDGYPEEEMAILNGYVRERLGRLMPLPVGAEELRRPDGSSPWIALHSPYVGVDARVNRGNETIDDQEFSVLAGLNLNMRSALQVQAGTGRIKQTLSTNRFITAERTSNSSSVSNVQTVENGEVTNTLVRQQTSTTITVQSNIVDRTSYNADKNFLNLRWSYTHKEGSLTLATVGLLQMDGSDIVDESTLVWNLEHQWRPVPAIDIAAYYSHGLVPSAREVLTYDGVGIRPFWRVRDHWESVGMAYFAYYDDRNSYLRGQIENFWRVSQAYDFWIGLHSSLETMDRDSDLYFSPFWDQRHYAMFRLRRTFPDFFAMFRVNIGIAKSDVRREERDRFENARAQGEAEGWSPGSGPDTGWNRLLGFSATLTRSWDNGFEITGELDVNSTDEYTEHTAYIRLMYTF